MTKSNIFASCCSAMIVLSWMRLVPALWADSKYDYPRIREEYADAFCQPDPSEGVSLSSDQSGCVLDKPISLADGIRICLKNNPDTRIAIARISQADAIKKKAFAAFYPSFGLYSEYMRADAPSAFLFKTIDQRKYVPGTDFNDPGCFDNFETGIQMELNLFNGGRDALQHKMAATGLTINREGRRIIENALVASFINAYYDYMAAEDFIEIAKESEATVSSELDIMKVRLRGGGVLKSDVLSLEVRLAEVQEAVVKSRNQHQMAMAALANLLGVSPDRKIMLKKSDEWTMDVPKDYKAGVAQALNTRPELKKVREELRHSRMALDHVEGEYLPNIDLNARYYHDDPDMSYDRDRENWVVGVMFSWNFFSGFSTQADSHKAAAKIHEILAADRKTLLAVQLDVKNAYLRLSEAKARLDVAQKSVASAEESLELVKIQYEGGSATITRYLEAELARNTARIRVTRAFYDRQQAVAEIGRAVGLLSDTDETSQ